MIFLSRKKGFTVAEIVIVVSILAMFIATVWVAAMPYFSRSRDTSRIADIASLKNVFNAYRQSADTFPSNFGSGGNPLERGYCVSEIVTRPDFPILPNQKNDKKFTAITKGFSIPKERALPIAGLCSDGESYSYIKHTPAGSPDEYAFIASSLEVSATANLGNAGYLRDSTRADFLFMNSNSSTGVALESGDQVYYQALK